jgi:hypothetical protein
MYKDRPRLAGLRGLVQRRAVPEDPRRLPLLRITHSAAPQTTREGTLPRSALRSRSIC